MVPHVCFALLANGAEKNEKKHVFLRIMLQEPECSNEECDESTALQLCSGCRKVRYCSVTCQKEDHSSHKVWCKAAGQANTCQKCTHVSETVGPAYTVLHCDRISTRPPDDDNFTWVFHSPYTGQFAREFVGNFQFIGSSRESDTCDTVVVHNGFIHSGDWDVNFAGDGLKKSIENREKSCVVCEKDVKAGVSCGQCQTPICYECVEVLVRKRHEENRCPECEDNEQYQCPACKAALRYTGQIIV